MKVKKTCSSTFDITSNDGYCVFATITFSKDLQKYFVKFSNDILQHLNAEIDCLSQAIYYIHLIDETALFQLKKLDFSHFITKVWNDQDYHLADFNRKIAGLMNQN